MHRDLDELAAGIARWLGDRRGVAAVELDRCERASGGLSSETLMVDARGRRNGEPWRESLVVRLAPAGPGIFPEYDLGAQAVAQEVAAAYGVPTAVPAEVVADPGWLGAAFLVMPAKAGYVPGPVPLHDPWLAEAPVEEQARAFHAVLDVLAAVHTIDTEALDTIERRGLDAEITYWRRYLGWYGDGAAIVPALGEALDWCVAHRPTAEPPAALLWGDVRLGNVIFDEARAPVAILDWEMTTIGAPEHDLAWFLALVELQDDLMGERLPGFPDRAAAVAHYEQAVGRTVVDLAWFEILALIRSIAIMTRLGFLEQQAGRAPALALTDNPLLSILARAIAAYGA